jgi:hypothetical protein
MWLVGAIPFAVLASYPPVAFDETLYHLPFVRALAQTGRLEFLGQLRFPIFPELHEALCAPVFMAFGDTATHFVALLELLLLAAVLYERYGVVAAALCAGSPIVVQVATITYVDAALMLFVGAAFVCLDEHPAVAGFLLGTACSVKYLGWYFAAAALVYLAVKGRWRPYALALTAAVLPTYAVILALSGNPVFPFFGKSEWAIPLREAVAPVRVLWDITFARHRVNYQPPYSPLFAIGMIVAVVKRHWIGALCLGYLGVFAFLHQDSRYLLPLVPLVSIVAAGVVPERWRTAAAVVAVAPAFAYAAFCFARQGPPPITSGQRRAYIERRVPEYRALQQAQGKRVLLVCGAERLSYYGGGERGRAEDFDYILIPKRPCETRPEGTLVYADAAAELWRIERRSAMNAR